MASLWEAAVILALTLLNAFFAGSEIAVLSVRKSRLRELVERGDRRARRALSLRDQPEQFLATVQVGITVVGATSGAFGGAVLEQPIAASLRGLGIERGAEQVALALVVILVSSLSIVVGELVPKSLALRSAEPLALVVAGPLLWLSRVAAPVVWLLTKASNLVLRPFGDQTSFTESRLSPDELQQLVDEAAAAGALDAGAGEIASRAIDLGRLRVAAVMVSRTAIVKLTADCPPDEAREVLRTQPHARYVVTDEDGEQVLGYVTAREVYHQLLDGRFDLAALVRPIPVFAELLPAVDALRRMQAARAQIGVVVDELGGIAGLVSVEDIAEELVGEILEENEAPTDLVREEAPGVFVMQGTAPIHEVNRELGLELPEGPGRATIAGLVIHAAGTIPPRGALLMLARGVEAEVLDASAQRVRAVRLRIFAAEEQTD